MATPCRFESGHRHQRRIAADKLRTSLCGVRFVLHPRLGGHLFATQSYQAEPGRISRSGFSLFFVFCLTFGAVHLFCSVNPISYTPIWTAFTRSILAYFLYQFPHSDARVEILCNTFQDSGHFFRPDLFALASAFSAMIALGPILFANLFAASGKLTLTSLHSKHVTPRRMHRSMYSARLCIHFI